jgi:hypothetical protein
MRHSLGCWSPAAFWLALTPCISWGCATCGCSVDSEAAMGYSATTGLRVNLEYTFIDQNELRSGSRVATAAAAVNNPSNPALGGGEIEKQTLNRYLTLGLGYRPTVDWNINLLVPYVSRDHTTYGNQPTPYSATESAPDLISSARLSSIGDIKLLGSYQGFLPTHELGVQLGVKLPTGPYGTAVDFRSGPAAGSPLDASLQAGTGSTDLIAGAYFFKSLSEDYNVFASVQFQAAIAHKADQPGSDYRPGNATTASAGVRYEANPNWVPQLQLNVTRKGADQGALADTTDTAGTVVYLSPGLTGTVSSRLRAYAVVQVPVYSRLDGYQLFPHWTATAGLSYLF